MGFIFDTEDELVGLERRRKSYNICDLQRIYPGEPGFSRKQTRVSAVNIQSEHIFAYADGEIEVSKDFLNRLLLWFENHPEERNKLKSFTK